MPSMFENEPPTLAAKAKEEALKLAAAAQDLFSDAVNTVSATVRGATDQSAGRKLKRKCTRRRGKKGGCFSLKWLKSKFSGSRKRKTGRKSRKR